MTSSQLPPSPCHHDHHPIYIYRSYIGVQGGGSLSFASEQHVRVGRHPQHVQANHAQTLFETVLQRRSESGRGVFQTDPLPRPPSTLPPSAKFLHHHHHPRLCTTKPANVGPERATKMGLQAQPIADTGGSYFAQLHALSVRFGTLSMSTLEKANGHQLSK